MFIISDAAHVEQFDSAAVLLDDEFDACAIYRVSDTVPDDCAATADGGAASFAEMTLPRNLRLCPSSVTPGVSHH